MKMSLTLRQLAAIVAENPDWDRILDYKILLRPDPQKPHSEYSVKQAVIDLEREVITLEAI